MPSSPRLRLSQPFSLKFEAIGTSWTIEVYEAYDRLGDLQKSIQQRIAAFDHVYSRFRADSVVAQIAREAGNYRLPDDAAPMFNLYQQLYDLTDGAMTPLIGQALSDAGYDASYSLQPMPIRSVPAWQEVMTYDGATLTAKRPVLLDFGAAGKGYLIDLVAQIMVQADVRHYSIDAGGDIVTVGQTLNVGLEHPDNLNQVIGVAQITQGSICGSAGNRRRWATYHHVIDPHSLTSPKHIKALWVTAPTALVADGLATALYFAPADSLRRYFEFEYAIMHEDYSLVSSPGFPAQFFGADS
ncbi:MAG: FAD:protein transferase [Candidatus Saccharibacteria bacterium]|nr:FAD:protein transferase [Candidatus Saccharibacteria bacterium]